MRIAGARSRAASTSSSPTRGAFAVSKQTPSAEARRELEPLEQVVERLRPRAEREPLRRAPRERELDRPGGLGVGRGVEGPRRAEEAGLERADVGAESAAVLD